MKTLRIATLIAAALLTVGTASAQGRRGSGYGVPPRTDEERSARQEQRQNANGATCPKCGVCDGSGAGQGQGKVFGQGKGQGKGASAVVRVTAAVHAAAAETARSATDRHIINRAGVSQKTPVFYPENLTSHNPMKPLLRGICF